MSAVIPADVQRIARTYLDPERMVIVVVGDRAAGAMQVVAIGRIVEQ